MTHLDDGADLAVRYSPHSLHARAEHMARVVHGKPQVAAATQLLLQTTVNNILTTNLQAGVRVHM